MMPLFETLSMLISFLFSYLLLFVWLPSFVIRYEPDSNGIFDKLFINLTHSTLFFIVVVHVLAAIRLLETLSLIGLTILCFILVSRFYSRSQSVSLSLNLLTALFDLSEDRNRWKLELKKMIGHFKEKIFLWYRMIIQTFKSHPLLTLGFMLVFGAAMIDRLTYSFTHLSFASSDSYVHLGWSKYLSEMTFYLDGVYPYGFESIIAVLYRVFHLDMYVTVRFMGALSALLMTCSLVYVLLKMIGKDYATILITVFVLFYSASIMVHNEVILWRQLSALSMEYAAIFLMPGIAFIYLFFTNHKRIYLLLASECYAITVFIHPFVAAVLTIAYVTIGLVFFKKLWVNRTFLKVAGYMIAAGIVGITPPIIGLLCGKPFHGSSINYVKGELSVAEQIHKLDTLLRFMQKDTLIALMCLFTALYAIGCFITGFLKSTNRQPAHKPLLFAGLFVVAMVVMLLAPDLGLPSIVAVDRQPVFLTMANALLFGVISGYLAGKIRKDGWRRKIQFVVGVCIVLLIMWFPGQKAQFPPGDQHQYDEAVRAYLDIKKSYPLLLWDIISPVDELGMIKGYGFHTELWEFVRDLDDPGMRTIRFTTPYVFLFVEKVPIDIMGSDFRPIAFEDAAKPFPVATDSNLTEFYYGSHIENRRILEAKAYYWAEEYLKTHQEMKVYMETERYKIYEVYQGKDEVVLNMQREGAG